MTMRALKTSATLLSSVIILSLTATNAAHALCVAGSAGADPVLFDSNECVSVAGAQVRYDQNCTTDLPYLAWEVPLPANAGSHTVAISGVNTTGLMVCYLCAAPTTGETACTQTLIFPQNTSSIQSGTITVPTNGHLWTRCLFPRGAGINTINYSQ
jgi:hypothetical protein